MIYKNVCTKREYEVNGVKKVAWLQCGTLRVNDAGKEFIELNILPNTPLYVFPRKEKEEISQTSEQEWLSEGK